MGNRAYTLAGTLLLGLFLCCLVNPLTAEEKVQNSKQQAMNSDSGESFLNSFSLTSRKEPIAVRSNGLEFLYDEKRIVYRGDVVATQGAETLKSNVLTITYEDAPAKNGAPLQRTSATSTSQQQIKEIIAEGDVEIVSGDRRATAKKAVFNESTRTVVLSGNAVLQEGQNRVSGERVTIYIDERRTVVEGDARVDFIPSQQERKQ